VVESCVRRGLVEAAKGAVLGDLPEFKFPTYLSYTHLFALEQLLLNHENIMSASDF
jgi:hypothetical protein